MPAGPRFISTLRDKHLYIQALEHVLDRPCIDRCLDYGNYEPSTAQFRLRAGEANTYVVSNYDDIGDFEHDRLTFSRTDLSLYRILEGDAGRIISARVQPGERLPRQEIAVLSSSPDKMFANSGAE